MEVDKNDTIIQERPEVFEIKFLSSELENVFTDILGDATVNEVIDLMRDYVSENIEPIGWKAVWEPSSDQFAEGTTFLGNVINVDGGSFEAEITFYQLLSPEVSELSSSQFLQANRITNSIQNYRVPLIELKVVDENTEQDAQFAYDNAVVIEELRFFFTKIWRPYDEYDESRKDRNFIRECFIPRISFAISMKNNLIADKYQQRFHAAHKESFRIKKRLSELNKKISELSATDDNDEDAAPDSGDDEDAFEFITLRRKLQDLDQEMRDIEDDILRFIYPEIHPDKLVEETDQSVVHIVSPKVSFSVVKNALLLIKDEKIQDWGFRSHQTLAVAMKAARSGDRIYLTENHHEKQISWIDKSVELIGLGESVELNSDDLTGDVFFFISCSGKVKFSNLTIRTSKPLKHLFVVKSGELSLEKCTLDCNNMVSKEIILTIGDVEVHNYSSNRIINARVTE